MKIVATPPGGGKTTELIRMCAEAQVCTYIVCTSHKDALRIARQAKSMGLHIPFPLTAEEWFQTRCRGSFIRALLFDDLDRILQGLCGPVEVGAISLTTEKDHGA